MKELLDDALGRIAPYISKAVVKNGTYRDAETLVYRSKEDYGYFNSDRNDAVVTRLRMDWELAYEGDDTPEAFNSWLESDAADIANVMLGHFGEDLFELLVDGDVNNTSDALLKSMDGAKKRGTDATMIDIFSAQLHREYKPKKKSVEFTLFILLATKWS